MEAPPTDIQKYLYDMRLLIEKGKDLSEIESALREKGTDEIIIKKVSEYLKKINHKKRIQNGSFMVLIGVILLGLGFISCIFLHDNGLSVDIGLYGLTGLGALILIIGLYLLFN